jgi:hypothetical protein
MDPVANLVQELSLVARLLSEAGEDQWHKYVADCRARISAGDYAGVEKLLRGVRRHGIAQRCSRRFGFRSGTSSSGVVAFI